MTSKEKRFEKIIQGKQKSYKFSDIKSILGHYGFRVENAKSSHFIFRHPNCPHITIVTHDNQVKQYYVKRAVEILKENQIIK